MITLELDQMIFPGQQDNEKVQDFIAKHWVVEIPVIIKVIVVGLIYLAGLWAVFNDPFEFPRDLMMMGLAVLSLVTAGIFIRQLIDWLDQLLDVFILTNKRLISFEQEGVFKRTTKEMDLKQIEDALGEQETLIDNLFRIGKLVISNKSENIIFQITNIPQPHLSKRVILDARDKACAREVEEEREREIEEVVKRTQVSMKRVAEVQSEVRMERGNQNLPEDQPELIKQIEVPDA